MAKKAVSGKVYKYLDKIATQVGKSKFKVK